MNRDRQPGDLIIDRYMPDADDAVRAQAREDLKGFVRALLRVAVRRALEQQHGGDSRNLDRRRKITPAP